MSPTDLEYYRMRGQAERVFAVRAATKIASDSHRKLARFYENLVELEMVHGPLLRIVSDVDAELIASAKVKVAEAKELLRQPVLRLPPPLIG
jgi:hypothetical protein